MKYHELKEQCLVAAKLKSFKSTKLKRAIMSNLSWEALIFLLERTNFSEPWMGMGFATKMKETLLGLALEKVGNNPVRLGIFRQLQEKLG